MPGTGETHFGYQTVDLADKQGMVDEVFQRVARRYDLMNDLMSGGLHRVWKDAMVTVLNPPRSGRYAVVDVAGGTGDVAFRIAEAGGARTTRDCLRHQRRHACRRARTGAGSAGSMASSGSQPAMPRRCRSPIAARMPHHRLRHPQRAAHRRGARRISSRAAARRALSLSGIFDRRRAGPRPALRSLLLQRHPGARPRGGGRRARPIAISSNRSAAFRARKPSPT